SAALNWIRNTLDAHIANGSNVTAGAGTVTVSASDNSTINGIAGAGAGAGTASLGAPLSYNFLRGNPRKPPPPNNNSIPAHNAIQAYIDNSTVTAGNVAVSAIVSGTINNATVAGSGGGTFALGGSLSLNRTVKSIDAHVSGGSTVNGSLGVSVQAQDTSTINA